MEQDSYNSALIISAVKLIDVSEALSYNKQIGVTWL